MILVSVRALISELSLVSFIYTPPRFARPPKGDWYYTIYMKHSRFERLYESYRRSDKRKGMKCTTTPAWIRDNILEKPCYYCGSTERIGCDRLDNSKAHTPENVVPCCCRCNLIRNDHFTPEQMKQIATFIKTLE